MRVFRNPILQLSVWVQPAFIGMAAAQSSPSPLTVITDGRDVARTSNLTEAGAISLSQGAVNLTLYISGALGIIIACVGIYRMWSSQADTGPDSRRVSVQGFIMILLGGLLTIPAIIAAIAPNAILGG